MTKYIVVFYNRFACETQLFVTTAEDEEDAEDQFWMMHPKELFHEDCIEMIDEA